MFLYNCFMTVTPTMCLSPDNSLNEEYNVYDSFHMKEYVISHHTVHYCSNEIMRYYCLLKITFYL